MGRRIPLFDHHHHHHLNLPFLQISFLAATLAASIAIITALCGVRHRKKPSSSSSPPKPQPPPSSSSSSSSSPDKTPNNKELEEPEKSQDERKTENEEEDQIHLDQIKELPLPPALKHPNKEPKSPINIIRKATSERRLSFSLSMKVPRSLSLSRSPKEDGGGRHNKEKAKTEDSVWMKTIILGDKCVPDEEEDNVIYEGKGKKISAYHPRHSSSMSLCRQMSFIDPDDSLSSDPQHSKT